jgi:hypothetical protein
MQKLTARVYQRWTTILGRVPGSVLWLLSGTADTNERVRKIAADSGIAPERIIFADKMANPDHLARYPLADLFLDSFPYRRPHHGLRCNVDGRADPHRSGAQLRIAGLRGSGAGRGHWRNGMCHAGRLR